MLEPNSRTLKNYSGASTGREGSLGPRHMGRPLTGRAARRSHGDTRARRRNFATPLQALLYSASQRRSQPTGAIMNPPITYRTSKPAHRKAIKRYARKVMEANAD